MGKRVLFTHFLINTNLTNNYTFYNLNIIKDNSIKNIVEELNYDLIFVGHEHQEFSISNKLYCIGSSGCRKDNITKYTIFDTTNFNIETKIIEYDRNEFIQDLLKNNYPERELLSKCFFNYEIK